MARRVCTGWKSSWENRPRERESWGLAGRGERAREGLERVEGSRAGRLSTPWPRCEERVKGRSHTAGARMSGRDEETSWDTQGCTLHTLG